MQTGTDNSEKEVVYIKADSIQTQNQSQSQELSSCAGIATQVRDHLCTECKLVRPDPTEKELVMYLHALRYKGPDFEYSTRIPEWAREDWEED
uniref:Uncharacterized protein n=2 Tax=Anguilla anguilla TaxID=7936 RepID=A0A0E9WLW4_ANGAN